MDRRRDMNTDESGDSLGNLYLGIKLHILSDQEMSSAKPEELLHRMLSARTAISISSSLAEEYQRIHDGLGQKIFSCIGKGQCGTFVLGTSPVVSHTVTPADLENLDIDTMGTYFTSDYKHRSIAMWLLDFNQCLEFSKDQQGVKKLVDGF
ncbi:hypothetical protein EJ04DRAFT_565732 [Polyplosphaeria fusca]|uniref:DUF3669 domain-containing protein n=1 Tax=Polyplosphaeria fusca TaxID=682080 RepID=A0A9P4QXG9_9PLEO|nr:hypothetical protein EJ04DRAFT_565732 [Polyplosphaeria fusca]